MLPKHKRMRKDVFQQVLRAGSVYHSLYFTLRNTPSSKEGYAVSVSKKVAPHAVDRNRIRRRAYAALRELLPTVVRNPSHNLFSAKQQAANASFEDIRKDVGVLLSKARIS